MKLLTQNAKMRRSGGAKYALYNFGIPAFRSEAGESTCPNAGACAAGCYARQGAYVWPAVRAASEARYQLTKDTDAFKTAMAKEFVRINRLAARDAKQLVIRIHDSGDFYSWPYFLAWIDIMKQFPEVVFYAYTKQVSMLTGATIPDNFKLNFSYGGKQDALINPKMSNSKVFKTLADLKRAGYHDTSKDDSHAFSSAKTRRIGLVYHGAKSFDKTAWGKVD